MPSQQQNITQIPSNRVEIIDSKTGMVSREWYRFFLNLFNLAGAGGNQVSLDDLQLSPPPLPTTTSGGGGSGTVTFVDVSGGTTGLTTSGGPVTTSGTITLAGTLAVASGGTDATTAVTARSNLSAAQSGANTDITSIALTSGTVTTAPSSSSDLVNKSYADSIASGVNFHAACNYATTTALSPANTYNNGSSGVGATLTASSNGTLTIDGYTFVVGDVNKRILVKDEATGANNGVYTLTQAGTASLPYILTRATDYDTSGSGTNEIDQGDLVLVLAGTTNANTSWVQQTPLPITVGTTALVFIQFAAVQTYTAGTGLTLTTNQFSITNTGTSGTYGSGTAIPVFVTNAQGQVTSVTNTTATPAVGSITGLGTGVGTFLATPTSANLATAVTDETGSGALVFATSPTLVTPILGTPQSGNFSTGTFTWPTFNQNTSGSAATLTTARAIYGNNFDGSAALTQIIASTYGGTGNGFTKFSGATTAEKTYSLPDATTTILTTNAAVTIAQGGTGQTTQASAFNALSPITLTGDLILGNGANSATRLAIGANGYVLTSNGTTASWAAGGGSGATITNDVATSTNVYPVFANATSGTFGTAYTSNANYLYKPSTGELTAIAMISSNGIQVNANTVATSYTIATGNNGLSAGPVSVNSGITVTVSSGSTWSVV